MNKPSPTDLLTRKQVRDYLMEHLTRYPSPPGLRPGRTGEAVVFLSDVERLIKNGIPAVEPESLYPRRLGKKVKLVIFDEADANKRVIHHETPITMEDFSSTNKIIMDMIMEARIAQMKREAGARVKCDIQQQRLTLRQFISKYLSGKGSIVYVYHDSWSTVEYRGHVEHLQRYPEDYETLLSLEVKDLDVRGNALAILVRRKDEK